jgi:hypothetical protein
MENDDIDVAASMSRKRLVLKNKLSAFWWDYSLPLAIIVPMIAYFVSRPEPLHAVRLDTMVVLASTIPAFAILSMCKSTIDGNAAELLLQARKTVNSLQWTVVSSSNDHFVATTPVTGFTWGQCITIIAQQGKLYVNVRNRVARNNRSPFLFGMRNEHLEAFRELL